MQIELSKMSKIAGNWGNSTNVKNSTPESFILCALATKDVHIRLDEPEPAKYYILPVLISMQMISTNWT